MNLMTSPNFDIVIPVGPHEQMNLNQQLKHIRQNIQGFRRIYLIPFTLTYEINRAANENDCILVEENDCPVFVDVKTAISAHFDRTFPGKKNRNGWYLQQLIKLYAGVVIPDILDTYLVIDSDVFFLRPLQFFDDNNNPLYETGTENHLPYFEHMKRLHPTFKRMTNNSGICHHMIFETKYVKEMMRMVEDYHNPNHNHKPKNDEKQTPFWKIFIESVGEHMHHPVDYEESGASEYELYFHFMLQFHSLKISVRTSSCKLKWENKPNGSAFEMLKGVKNENENNYLDYISICHYMSKQHKIENNIP
jgi:hypothetical protein